MPSSRANIVREATSSIGTFAYSSAVYTIFDPTPVVLDFLLLAIGSLLPSRIGIRVGSIAGLLFGPVIAATFSTMSGRETYLPIRAVIFVGNNGKFILGLFGAIVGAITFNRLRRGWSFPRFWANVLTAAVTGLALGVVEGLLLIWLGLNNRHPPPNLMFTLMGIAIKDALFAFLAGGVIGVPYSLIDLIRTRSRDE